MVIKKEEGAETKPWTPPDLANEKATRWRPVKDMPINTDGIVQSAARGVGYGYKFRDDMIFFKQTILDPGAYLVDITAWYDLPDLADRFR